MCSSPFANQFERPSIKAANINCETLAEMEKVGQVMIQIHRKLNVDTIDQTTYAFTWDLSNFRI